MWRIKSLRWRLTLFYAGLLLILIVGLGIFVYFQLDRFLSDSSASRLRYQTAAKIVLPRAGRGRDNADTNAQLQRLVMQLENSNPGKDTYLSVYDVKEQQIKAPSGEGVLSESLAVPSNVQFADALTNADAHFVANVAGLGRAVIVILPVREQDLNPPPLDQRGQPQVPFNDPIPRETVQGFVVAAQGLAEADQTLNQLKLILGLGALGVFGLVLLLGLPIARLGLRPLNNMTITARRIANGDLSQRVPLKPFNGGAKNGKLENSQDEIRQLTLAFNQMLDQIETAFSALRQSEARTRQFVADASHELRSPLTTLNGSVEVLLMHAKDDPVQAEKLLTTMRREIERLSRLVIDLLQLTRLDVDGSQAFEFMPVRLDVLAAQVCEDFKIVAGKHQLTCDCKAQSGANADEVWVRGDADRLRQVLTNLLDNALRYTAPDGTIQVSVKPEQQSAKNWAVLKVQDNGVGIAAEHAGRIFDRFYRVDKARTRAGHAGLGLAIVKALVEAQAGTISVESQPGQGTTFSVRLPLLLR